MNRDQPIPHGIEVSCDDVAFDESRDRTVAESAGWFAARVGIKPLEVARGIQTSIVLLLSPVAVLPAPPAKASYIEIAGNARRLERFAENGRTAARIGRVDDNGLANDKRRRDGAGLALELLVVTGRVLLRTLIENHPLLVQQFARDRDRFIKIIRFELGSWHCILFTFWSLP